MGFIISASLKNIEDWSTWLTTAWTTYAKSFAIATSKALFSVSSEQISLIQLKIKGPAPS